MEDGLIQNEKLSQRAVKQYCLLFTIKSHLSYCDQFFQHPAVSFLFVGLLMNGTMDFNQTWNEAFFPLSNIQDRLSACIGDVYLSLATSFLY